MTREEAKELLLNISAYDIDMQRGMAKQEALDMAIKALEQTELKPSYNSIKTELNGDAISRQAVLDMLKDINADTDGVGFYYEHYFDYIKNLPPVTSQPNKSSTENQNKSDISQKCDRINSLASVLPYAPHREIQELLCEIMDLCNGESEE